MKKTAKLIFAVAIVVAFIMLFKGQSHSETSFALNTIINISAKGFGSKAAVLECINEVNRIENLLSAYKKESEVSKINTEAFKNPVSVSDETFDLILKSTKMSQITRGNFDITIKPLVDLWDINSGKNYIPSETKIKDALKNVGYENIILDENLKTVFLNNGASIDLGGIAKGYCADAVAKALKDKNVKRALVNLGGNIYVLGDKEYTIGLQDPNGDRGDYFGTVQVKNTSVVTSGAYERSFVKNGQTFHHIINPFNGKNADSQIISVTAIGENSAKCDAYATAVYVGGLELGFDLHRVDKDVGFVIVAENKKVYVTENVNFTLTNDDYQLKG